MLELLRIKTSQWELSVWCKEVANKQRALTKALKLRGSDISKSQVSFTATSGDSLDAETCVKIPEQTSLALEASNAVVTLPQPIFFENTQYQFEWTFFDPNISAITVEHKLASINDSFRFKKSNNGESSLFGVLNTGNDLGAFCLPLRIRCEQSISPLDLRFEVLPTKMDMHQDLSKMYEVIDSEFPLWRFSFAQKTEQSFSRSQSRGDFPLLWLAHFESLCGKMLSGLTIITHAPHSRLQHISRPVRAERLKGKIAPKLAERIEQDLQAQLSHKRYPQTKKQLSVDTPENRFIKMIVSDTKKKLLFIQKKIHKESQDDKSRLSQSFLDQFDQWQKPLARLQKYSFLREVGSFTGLNSESLVLQQKTGYSTVYRVWQELKHYLSALAGQSSVSVKSVAEVYEVWCFLELRRILTQSLGFREVANNKGRLTLKDFEYQMTDGFKGAFEFEREDNQDNNKKIRVRLVHEPAFNKKGKNIRTYLVQQKPDILLEATFPNGKKCIWLFDAKYRIERQQDFTHNDSESYNEKDLVPNDAINQMHRYRDALIHIESSTTDSHLSQEKYQKSRPVFGAFALYPGYFDQENSNNLYDEAISEIGIGAFPLLPTTNGYNGRHWLEQYLTSQIGVPQEQTYSKNYLYETLHTQEATKIPLYGTQQSLYPDLAMTLALGGAKGRNKAYMEGFYQGTARYYHIPVKTFESAYQRNLPYEIKFLAIATQETKETSKSIVRAWPVKNVTVLKRSELSVQQSGKPGKSTNEEPYYLFELGSPIKLARTVTQVPTNNFRNSMRLTTLAHLNDATVFKEVKKVYSEALKT